MATERTVWLAKFEPLKIDNVGGDVVEELWIASQHISVVNTQAGDPPSGVIAGLLLEPHRLSINALDADNMVATRSLPSLGDVTFGNPDGRFDEVLGWTFAQRQVTMWKGVEGETFWRDPPLWSALCGEPTAERHEITVPTIGIEELLRRPLQVNRYNPGFEPYANFGGVGINDTHIDFGDNLDRGTASFTFGVAFRTSAALATQGLYTKKPSLGGAGAGYSLGLGSGGSIRVDIADGVTNISVTHTPAGGYNSGQRISVVGEIDRTGSTLTLFVNLNDGTGWQNVGNSAIGGLFGGLGNALALVAGALNGGTADFLDGEIERLVMRAGAGSTPLQDVQNALDERFAEDVDPTPFIHYVPLTENTGLLVGDLSSSAFDGTINGPSSQQAWSGLQNGTRDLDGVPKPFAFGRLRWVRPRLIDPIKQVYHVHDQDVIPAIIAQLVDRGQLFITSSVGSLRSLFTTQLPVGSGVGFNGFFRVNSGGEEFVPAAVVRTDALGDDETVANAFEFVLNRLHGFGAVVSPGGPNPVAGFYWDGERDVTIGKAADEIASSISGAWSSNGRDPFNAGVPEFLFSPVIDPAGKTSVLTIRLDGPIQDGDALVAEDGLRRIGVARARSRIALEYQRFHGFFTQGQLLPVIDPQLFNEGFTSEFRTVTADAPQTILDRFVDSSDLSVRTGIRFQSDAQAEADRLVALHGQLIEVWECELTDLRFEGWVGDIVRVTGSLPTFETGREFLVVGVREDADDAGSTLTLWGPRPGTAP